MLKDHCLPPLDINAPEVDDVALRPGYHRTVSAPASTVAPQSTTFLLPIDLISPFVVPISAPGSKKPSRSLPTSPQVEQRNRIVRPLPRLPASTSPKSGFASQIASCPPRPRPLPTLPSVIITAPSAEVRLLPAPTNVPATKTPVAVQESVARPQERLACVLSLTLSIPASLGSPISFTQLGAGDISPEAPSPATARRIRTTKLRRRMGAPVPADFVYRGSIHENSSQDTLVGSERVDEDEAQDSCNLKTAIAVRKIVEMDSDSDSDSCDEEGNEIEDSLCAMVQGSPLRPVTGSKRYSKKWLREQGGRRWEEDPHKIIRALRKL